MCLIVDDGNENTHPCKDENDKNVCPSVQIHCSDVIRYYRYTIRVEYGTLIIIVHLSISDIFNYAIQMYIHVNDLYTTYSVTSLDDRDGRNVKYAARPKKGTYLPTNRIPLFVSGFTPRRCRSSSINQH